MENSTYNKIYRDYQLIAAESNPHGLVFDDTKPSELKYNTKAQDWEGSRSFRRDMKLVEMFMLKTEQERESIKYLTIVEDKASYSLIYDPYSLKKVKEGWEDYAFDYVLASKHEKASQAYDKASGELIDWMYRAISSEPKVMFNKKLEQKWCIGLKYRNNINTFAKDVGNIMKFYPHVLCETYGDWINKFMEWLEKDMDENMDIIYDIVYAVVDEIKTVIHKDKLKGLESKPDFNVVAHMTLYPCTIEVKECTRLVNKAFKDSNSKAVKTSNVVMDKLERIRQSRLKAKEPVVVQPKQVPELKNEKAEEIVEDNPKPTVNINSKLKQAKKNADNVNTGRKRPLSPKEGDDKILPSAKKQKIDDQKKEDDKSDGDDKSDHDSA